MAQYGYGSGGYLTRFEDYYKSSDESDDEDDTKDVQKVKTLQPSLDPRFDVITDVKNIEPLQTSIDFSQYILEESEDEDGLVERERRFPSVLAPLTLRRHGVSSIGTDLP